MSLSQTAAILAHLRTGASLSPLEALERYQCFRLAPRVRELRQAGHKIATHIERRGRKAWAVYALDNDAEAGA